VTTGIKNADTERRLPASREAARAEIVEWSQTGVDAILREPRLHGSIAGSKAFIDQAAIDYAGRFLYELIQNAYDAHPAGSRGGRIRVLLDPDEEEHGVLYVGNTGLPFDNEDFRAICEIAQSSKRPGQGIGNKGIGFKSVLLVTDWPEVHSMGPERSGDFGGYCFGFATDADLARMAGEREEDARIVLACASRYTLPVPVLPSGHVNEFAEAGMASVVRLPLRGPKELQDARDQMLDLRYPAAPVLLFLDRIQELVVEDLGDDRPHVMVREETDVDGCDPEVIRAVSISDDGEYLVAHREVVLEEFRSEVEASVGRRRLDPAWREWKDPVRVSVAVPLDPAKFDDRPYAFLPMGPNAHGPFAGHINAPFAIKLARDFLVDDVPLNDFLLDQAALLCAEVVLMLRDHPAARSVIPDLIAWRSPDHPRMVTAFAAVGRRLNEEAVIPVIGGGGWDSLDAAYRWDWAGHDYLSAQSFTRTSGSVLVDPALGEARLKRIESFHQDVKGLSMVPSADRLAEWTEASAKALLAASRRKFAPEAWAQFYDEVARVFEKTSEALAGRQFILDAEMNLRPALGAVDGAGLAVFFSHTDRDADESDVEADLSVPASLRRSIAYVHPEIPFSILNAQRKYENRIGRRFLEDRNLVRPFMRRTLFERVRDQLARPGSKRLYADALRFVYNLNLNTPYNSKPSRAELNLRVPTASGWIEASRARFGTGWTETQGGPLTSLISAVEDLSPEIAALRDRLLLPPSDWPSRVNTSTWTPFLHRIGVRDGLWPLSIPSNKATGNGIYFEQRGWLAAQLGLSAEDTQVFAPAAAAAISIGHPYTPYRVESQVVRLPGQSDFSRLPDDARVIYGRLVLEGLAHWSDWIEGFTLLRPNHGSRPDIQSVPSPAWAFLRTAAWVPVSRPGQPGVVDSAAATSTWTYVESRSEPQPLFAPLLAPDARALVSREKSVAQRLARLGVRDWVEPANAPQRLQLLTRLFAQGVAPSQLETLRNAYERSWAVVVGQELPVPWVAGESIDLLVTKGGQLALESVAPNAIGNPVHILIEQDARFAESLLTTLNRPLLAVEGRDAAAVARRLTPLLGTAIRTVRSQDFKVHVDGQPVEPSPNLTLLVDAERGWLAELLAMTLVLKAPALNRQTANSVREAVERLRLIRLCAGRQIHLELDGQPLDLPTFLPPVFAVPDPETPVVAFRGSADQLTWRSLELLAPVIAGLVNQPWAGPELRNVMTELGRLTGAEPVVIPTDEDLSLALGQDIARIVSVRRSQRTFLDDLVYRLRPAVRYLLGATWEDRLLEALDAPDPRSAMTSVIDDGARSTGAQVDGAALIALAERARSLAELRDQLEIDFGAFNRVLRELGRPYEPDHHDDEHAAAFAAFLQEQRKWVLDALRATTLASFDAGASVQPYADASAQLSRAIGRRPQAQDLPALQPDPAWLDDYLEPAASLMDHLLHEWLLAVGCDPAARTGLPEVDATRTANAAALSSLACAAAPILRAWSSREQVFAPPWVDTPESVVSLMETRGELDHRILDAPGLLARLGPAGLWPVGMPPTLDLAELRLAPADLERQQSEVESRRALADRSRRGVILKEGDRIFTLDADERQDLLSAVLASLSRDFLATSAVPVGLDRLDPRKVKRIRKDGDNPPSPPPPRERMSDAKKELIGFIGELTVYQWASATLGAGPEAWASRNRRFRFSDYEGRDDLGYDFEIPRRRGGSLLVEVKASAIEDGFAFEMTETEVLVAREHRGNHRYVVAFVADVLNPARRLLILPNPLSPAGEGRFRVGGSGIKYEFAPIV
jgi:hypothetical protein